MGKTFHQVQEVLEHQPQGRLSGKARSSRCANSGVLPNDRLIHTQPVITTPASSSSTPDFVMYCVRVCS